MGAQALALWKLGFVGGWMTIKEAVLMRKSGGGGGDEVGENYENGDELTTTCSIRRCLIGGGGGGAGLAMQPVTMKRVVAVGYAVTSKKMKIKSFLQPKLERLARNKGIQFVPIDPKMSLSEQGPFDIVLHKLTGKEWLQILEFKYFLKDPVKYDVKYQALLDAGAADPIRS